jgi:hypothetical protein
MHFEVIRFEPPWITVKDKKTDVEHRFVVRDDGTIADDRTRSDLIEARRTAVRFLFDRRKFDDDHGAA